MRGYAVQDPFDEKFAVPYDGSVTFWRWVHRSVVEPMTAAEAVVWLLELREFRFNSGDPPSWADRLRVVELHPAAFGGEVVSVRYHLDNDNDMD